MALTLGFTGMDSATEAALTAAFAQANARLGSAWRLLSEIDADHVVVDMDSMYGPMSWLRLHAAGKQVIGLTSASRTQADFHLPRPFDIDAVIGLLQSIAPVKAPSQTETPRQDATAPTRPVPVPVSAPAKAPTPSGMSPSPSPQDMLPEEHPQPVDEEAEAPAPAPGLPGSVQAGTLAPTTITPITTAPTTAAPATLAPTTVAPATIVPATTEPKTIASTPTAPAQAALPPAPPVRMPPSPRELGLADWLAPGTLRGRLRYRKSGSQPLLIDADARLYYATPALKPLAAAFEGVAAPADFEPIDEATWARETVALGAAQPLNRLQWYGGLVAGKGVLLPEFDPAGRYKLSKWPQTEREFPKHFRLATAMMKGPATLEEVATASGVPIADVIDFVNASLVSGYAEFVPEPSAEPIEPPKPTGLFGRLRGK